MGGLVKLLGIEGATETQVNTGAEEGVVSDGSHTTVVDLGLIGVSNCLLGGTPTGIVAYLGEGQGVKTVLAGNLETDVVAGLGVPGSLGTGLDLAVDLVVVAGSEDAQVVSSGDGSAVRGGSVADGSAVAGEGCLLDIVAGRGTSEETIVANNGINVGGGTLEQVEEGAAVEGALLEVEVELGAARRGGGQEDVNELGLDALGEHISGLDLALEGVDSVPGLGQSKA